MFSTRPSVSQYVSQSVSPSVLFFLSSKLLYIETAQQNFVNIVVNIKDIMCRFTYPQEIFIQFLFSELRPFFELRNLAKMKDSTVLLVSATPLKPLNRIS